MESSNPLVVTKATRAPLRCKSVFVPTVVACKRRSAPGWPIWATASAMAFDGSSGVEKTFSMRSAALAGSAQTQSVKVPPVSTATRNGGIGFLRGSRKLCDFTQVSSLACRGKLSAFEHQIGGDEEKEDDGDDSVHRKEGGIQFTQVFRVHQRVFVDQKDGDDGDADDGESAHPENDE